MLSEKERDEMRARKRQKAERDNILAQAKDGEDEEKEEAKAIGNEEEAEYKPERHEIEQINPFVVGDIIDIDDEAQAKDDSLMDGGSLTDWKLHPDPII